MSTSRAHENIIKSWIETTLKTGGIERFDDLHVDQIDSAWKKREHWMEAGFKTLKTAITLRDRLHLPADVTLAFSLVSDGEPHGVDFKNATELEENFDWSPPSLYLLFPGMKPWSRTYGNLKNDPVTLIVKKVSLQKLAIQYPFESCYHIEFKPLGSSEYRRSLFFMGVRE